MSIWRAAIGFVLLYFHFTGTVLQCFPAIAACSPLVFEEFRIPARSICKNRGANSAISPKSPQVNKLYTGLHNSFFSHGVKYLAFPILAFLNEKHD